MSLTPGARLGPYEILSPLGAGGMGEAIKHAIEIAAALDAAPRHIIHRDLKPGNSTLTENRRQAARDRCPPAHEARPSAPE